MANLNYFIQERVKLNGKERGTSFNVALLSDVVDFSGTPGAGQFVSSSLMYFRFTNHSTGSVILQVSSSTENFNIAVAGSGSFMINTTSFTGSFQNVTTFDNITKIKATPVDTTSIVEYFLVSK